MAISDGDTVTIEYTGRLPDGTVFDTSREPVATEHGLAEESPDREFGPLSVEVGSEHVIEGLEEGLRGMEAGDTATVEVSPEKGYGEYSEDRIVNYDAGEFTEMLGGRQAQAGMTVQTEDGLPGEVLDADDDVVRVDFNHELAGETLEFEIEVLEVA